jgi:hypothetical protein
MACGLHLADAAIGFMLKRSLALLKRLDRVIHRDVNIARQVRYGSSLHSSREWR